MIVNRRTLLTASLATAAIPVASMTGCASAPPSSGSSSKANSTYVLIHGGYHGGWCWSRVKQRLQKEGHTVHAPSLTGLADRSHLISGLVTLDTHIQDIVNLFHWEQLNNVVLVAHSYGGWPVTGALEQIADKVSSVVYLDAFLPENGQSGMDLLSPTVRKLMDDAVARGETSRPVPKAEYFQVQRQEDRKWVDRMMTPQPIGVARQPIKLSGALNRVPLKTYIRAPVFKQANFDAAYERAKRDPAWRTHEFSCGHNIMIDEPERLTAILLTARS
ncbi:MAG: esterase [Burkholderia sp.]|nr:esterase [Burkholderia sp.]